MAIKDGEVIITVTTEDGAKIATCKVIVKEKSVIVKPEADDDTDETEKPEEDENNEEDKLPQTGNEGPIIPIAMLAIVGGAILTIKRDKISIK